MFVQFGGTAWASTYLGSIRFAEGRSAVAEQMYRDAFAIFRQLGDRAGEAAVLHTRAYAHLRQGKLGEVVEHKLDGNGRHAFNREIFF